MMVASNVGLTVEVQDKTARGRRGVVRSFKEIKQEARKTTKETGRMDKEFGNLKKTMFGSIGKFAILAGGFATVTAAVTKAVGAALKFNTAMAEVSTLLPKGSKDVAILSDEIKRLSTEFGLMPVDQAKAAYQIISAGASTAAEATGILTIANKLAIGGVTDVTTAADGLTSVLNAYGLSSSEATRVSDAMFVAMKAGKTTIAELAGGIGGVAPLAAQTGVEIESLLAATAALTKGGVSTSVAMRGLRQVIAMVIKPSSEALTLSEDLGLEFNALALESKGLQGFLQDVADKTGNSSEKMALLFGGVEALVPVLSLTGAGVKDFNQTLVDMGTKAGQTDEALEKMMSTPQKQLDIFMTHMDVAAVSFGESILDAVTPVLVALNKILEVQNKIIKLDLSKVVPLGENPLWATDEPPTPVTTTLVGGMTIGRTGGLSDEFRNIVAESVQTQAVGGGTGGFTQIQTQTFGERPKTATEIAQELTDVLNEKMDLARKASIKEFSPALGTGTGVGTTDTPDDVEISNVIDLDVATPWIDALKSMGQRSVALQDAQANLKIERLKTEDASAVEIETATAALRMKQLDRTQAAEKLSLLQKGVSEKEIIKLHRGEKALTKARSDLKIKTATLTDEEKKLAAASAAASEAFRELQQTMQQIGSVLSMVGPKSAAAMDTVNSMMQGFAAGGPLGAAVAGFTALPGLLGHTAEAAAEFQRKMQKLNDELLRGKDKANSVIDSLFGGDTEARQNEVFAIFEEWFEFFRGPTFKGGTGGYTGDVGTDETIRGTLQERERLAAHEVFDRLARADALATEGLGESAKLYQIAGKSAADFRDQVNEAFGSDSTLSEVGEIFFETSEAFDHLRDSAEEVTNAVTQLSEAEKAAIHARFAGEAQGASGRLQERFRTAGGDQIARAAAFKTYQAEIAAILDATGAAVTRSAATGTGTATDYATRRTTTEQVVAPTVKVDPAELTTEVFVNLPNAENWDNFWSNKLLGPMSDPIAAKMIQLVKNIEDEQRSFIPTQFIALPDADAFDSFWSREFLGIATTAVGNKLGQVRANINDERDEREYHAADFLTMPLAASFENLYTTMLMPVMSGDGELGRKLANHQKNTHKERDDRKYYAADFLTMPLAKSFEKLYTRMLMGVMSGNGELGRKLDNHRKNTNKERDDRQYYAADFLTMPLAQSFADLYTTTLMGRMSGNGELGRKLANHQGNTRRERNSRPYYGSDFLTMPTAASFANVYTTQLNPVMLGDGKLGAVLENNRVNIRSERDERVVYVAGDFLKMPTASPSAGSFEDFYSKQLQPRMLGDGKLGAVLENNRINIRGERDMRVMYVAGDFLKMPFADGSFGTFSDFYSKQLQPRMLGDGKLGKVLENNRINIRDERDNKVKYIAGDFLTMPGSGSFAALYSSDLQPRMLGGTKLGEVLTQVKLGVHNERDAGTRPYVAADFITLPTRDDFASHLMPLQGLIQGALQQVISQMNRVTVRAADLIDFDTSGVQDSIAAVVQDATDDRQFDDQFTALGYSGGRA